MHRKPVESRNSDFASIDHELEETGVDQFGERRGELRCRHDVELSVDGDSYRLAFGDDIATEGRRSVVRALEAHACRAWAPPGTVGTDRPLTVCLRRRSVVQRAGADRRSRGERGGADEPRQARDNHRGEGDGYVSKDANERQLVAAIRQHAAPG